MNLKKFTLLSLLATSAIANAAVPNDFEVTPEEGSVISELKEITIYTKYDEDIYSYPKPEITINGKAVNVTSNTSGEYFDLLTWTLKEPITEPGEYEIVIGAESFYYGFYEEDNKEMSWKFTIEGSTKPGDPDTFEPFENKDVTIYPEQGKYTSLNEFTLTFFNVTLPDINYLKSASLINEATNEVVAKGKASEGSIIQQLIIDLDKEITEPGTYTLLVPEGMFYDSGSYDEEDLPEMKFRYVVSADGTENKPAEYIVEATPADGSNVTSIESIILTYPEFDAIYKHDEKDIRIENAAGETVATGAISYGNTEANQMLIKFTPAVTEKGDYTVIIPKRAFSLGDMKFTVFSSEVVLTYHVTDLTAIENLEVSEFEGKPVYNVLGIKVADSMKNLPAGLYICNGRKVIVR